MKNILKFRPINCRTGDKLCLLKKLVHTKNGLSQIHCKNNKIGNGIISHQELKIGYIKLINNIRNQNICTENKVKDDNNLANHSNETINNTDTKLNYNIDNDFDREDNDIKYNGNQNSNLSDTNFEGNEFENYNKFNRYERKNNKEDGENGFINSRNERTNYQKKNNYNLKNDYDNNTDNNMDDYNNSYTKRDDHNNSRYSRNLNNSDRYSKLGDNLKDIEWNKIKVKIERQNLFNVNENKLKKLSNEEIQNELKNNNIYVNKDLALNSFITQFSDLDFHESILNYLNENFKEPTAIQKITWPIALSGKDLIGVAETGSGKTLAFVLPCLMHILKHKQTEMEQNGGEHIKNKEEKLSESNNNDNSYDPDIEKEFQNEDNEDRKTYGLILLPTRELCMQVLNEIKKFENELDLKAVAVYGGVPKYFQINSIKKGADIIVATPGRLLDYLENGIINLLRCIYVVIDEADRLLDMGFEKQLRKIMTQINKNKQLLFLTATWPEQVRKLAYDFCSFDPVKIQIGKSELTANKNIEQQVIVSSSIDLKKKLLDWLKDNYENNKILIFCDTKRNCDNLCKELRYHQYNSLSIHGDKQQRERDRILNNYKNDRCNILVATDVASRGLDIKNISIVINYDIPNTIEDYIHRIGRTGRAGNKGKSILFFPYDYYVPQKQRFAKDLVKLLNKTNQQVPKELREIVSTR
ncbi:ATP-dependent RNA helicase, putative [Plasmodium vinckei vinckei]|uniref:RNA helicase n=1 Tax=Plasmodium vinckei vinckei TaxID=54757 RepID=A0A449C0F4_PLAVN|nr:ATP-dependent RNA helicase, putative [Plasmodium vinckei vinckei]KEG04008.1 adenosinetriphosphatase [Plasmodium vinckei vinckei]VEV59195.1 ATP-dependent RNA helicase, putative [Plasmodium vinckei vinckei]